MQLGSAAVSISIAGRLGGRAGKVREASLPAAALFVLQS